ncbi:MAG: hypothetical protein IAC68_05465 [Bacteroidetes bacterium]|uniref:Uncharacterized protein n=1 Tax=Candidatus Egerieousia excrementavium TaxID=2840778 RepID=A0A9D9DMG2_9BACT|nr:hypothetical protein [Candidatus Egerieousia excrementavium]
MNKISFKILAASVALLLSPALFAQEQEMPSADDMALMEVEVLEEELELDATQIFLADSVLRHNYQALMDEFEKMKSSGMQSTNSYKTVSEKWMQKCKDAFQLFLDEQQYIKYLKHLGEGKEYKKGKDGLYYKKEKKSKK